MTDLSFRIKPEKLKDSDILCEASREELRVLLALIANGGCVNESDLASLASCSAARIRSSLTLWEEEGIIEKYEGTGDENQLLEYEHGRISHFSDLEAEPSLVVAETIRREDMSDLLDECASILGLAALSSTDAAKIVTLVKNLSLSGEYITTLLSFLKGEKKCNVNRLVKKAEELVGKGVDSYEELENYIRDRELPGYVFEYRRVFGIYGRSVSQTERECYKKWYEEFEYSTEIVALAFDKAVLAGASKSIQYVDTVLSGWHRDGCKTVAECEASSRAYKEAREAEKNEHAEKKRPSSKKEAPTPRYGAFDVEEAFRLALERSYGEEDEKEPSSNN